MLIWSSVEFACILTVICICLCKVQFWLWSINVKFPSVVISLCLWILGVFFCYNNFNFFGSWIMGFVIEILAIWFGHLIILDMCTMSGLEMIILLICINMSDHAKFVVFIIMPNFRDAFGFIWFLLIWHLWHFVLQTQVPCSPGSY